MERQDIESCLSAPSGFRRIGLKTKCALATVATFLLLAIGAGIFVWQIQSEDNSNFLREQVLQSLQNNLGAAHQVAVDKAGLQLSGPRPLFSLTGLRVANAENGAGAVLAKADLSLKAASLWRMSPEPVKIAFEGLKITLPHESASSPALLLAGLHAGLAAVKQATSTLPRALHEIDGRAISIVRRMHDGREQVLRDGLTMKAHRENGELRVQLGHRGDKQHVELVVSEKLDPASTKSALATLSASAGAVMNVLGIPVEGLDPALALQVALESGDKNPADGQPVLVLSARHGRIILPDPDIPPIALEQFSLSLQGSGEAGRILIPNLIVRFGEAEFVARGHIRPEQNGGAYLFLSAVKAVLDRISPQDDLVQLDKLQLEGRITPDQRSFELDRLQIEDRDGRGLLSGRFSLDAGGLIDTNFLGEGFDVRRAMRIWPVFLAPPVRQWVIDHVESGKLSLLEIRSHLEGQALYDSFAHKPIPDSAISARYRLDDVILRPIRDAAPLKQASISGHSSGRRANILLEQGIIASKPGKSVQMQNAEFLVADTAAKPATLTAKIPFSGSIDALMAYLAAPSIKAVAAVPTDLSITDGQAEGVVSLTHRLVAKPAPSDIRVDLVGELRNVVIDPLVKGEKLEGGNFQLQGRSGQVNLKGDARINTVPTQIEVQAEANKPTNVTLKTTLDDAQRAKRGFELRPFVTGPVGVIVSVVLEKGAPPDTDFELDFAKAKVEGIAPGFLKRAGQPGKASFDYAQRGDRTILEDFSLDLGTISAKGKLELGKDNGSLKADLTSLKLSPGDNARAVIDRTKSGIKITIRGNSFDLRPFLRGFQSGKIEDGKVVDLDLDLQSTVLVGFGGELIGGAEFTALRRNGMLTKLNGKGKFEGESLVVETTGQKSDHIVLRVDTTNAGALARFLEIYPRMFGGRMNAEIKVGNAGQRGLVQVRDFLIRGEPVFRQSAGASGSGPMAQGGRNADGVQFTKLRADFVRKPGRLELSEAVMWGGEVGGSLDGYLDYAGDKVDLKGTLVPAYALNNLFSQVPLFGPIFGGSQYEGLFALPFVITGKASAPVLRTNTLSVVAPGFLRKLFEIRREGEQR